MHAVLTCFGSHIYVSIKDINLLLLLLTNLIRNRLCFFPGPIAGATAAVHVGRHHVLLVVVQVCWLLLLLLRDLLHHRQVLLLLQPVAGVLLQLVRLCTMFRCRHEVARRVRDLGREQEVLLGMIKLGGGRGG